VRFGSLLIQGFRKKATFGAKKARPRLKRSAQQDSKPALPTRRPSSRTLPKQSSGALTRARRPASLVQQRSKPRAIHSALTTHRLIHPDERLRSSIEAFLLDQRSPHTRKAYARDLRRFLRFLAVRKLERGVESLERAVIVAYKDSLLAKGLEHTTVDRHLATLRSFFRFLVDDGHLPRSPAEGVRFLNPRRVSRTQAFADADVVRMLKIPDLHTRSGALHYAILMVLFYCGLRRSELCSLRTSGLSMERGARLLRLRGKGDAERLIVLPEPVWRSIEHYFRINQRLHSVDDALFRPVRNNRSGVCDKPLDPSAIFYIVRKYARAAGIAYRVSPHSCRATAISNARDHQVSDRAIQEFAGWSTPDMITRYDKRKASIESSASRAIRYGTDPDRI